MLLDNKAHQIIKKSFFASLAILSAFTVLSCSALEMRDCTDDGSDTQTIDESEEHLLSQAIKKNAVEAAPETEISPEDDTSMKTSFTFCGRVGISDSIISDAASRAHNGKDYSFLRMYTGVYNFVTAADVALCSYQSIVSEGASSVQPIESVAAINDLGIDIINTVNASDISDYLKEYQISELDNKGNITIHNINGLDVGYLTLGGNSSELSYSSDNLNEKIENVASSSDVVIVFVNPDNDMERSEYYSVIKKIAEAGADIIIGNKDELDGIEWIENDDGSRSLAVYSLGNLLCTSDKNSGILGGILDFTVSHGNGKIELTDVTFTPTVIHYTIDADNKECGFQVFELEKYSDDMAEIHALGGVTKADLIEDVRSVISDEFLSSAFID